MINMKKEKGITLIALVVTIIILIILAGVSITMVLGENGLIAKAKVAKGETETARENELYSFSEMEDIINESTVGLEVQQVIDKNPGVLEMEEGYAVINSIEDLVFFAYDVSSGNNNYAEKTVKLGLSLDFNSAKSYVEPFRTDYSLYGYNGELKTLLTSGEGFKSIGITTSDDNTKLFNGIFDGNGNFINNLYINVITNEVSEKRGLFSNNKGTINNLKLLNVNLYLKTNNGAIAGISGQNSMTGNINNCIVSGKIKNESVAGSAGGITCYSSGSIHNCGNIANVFNHTTVSNETYMGGISSSNGLSSVIENCYNMGEIKGIVQTGNLLIGGICGGVEGQIKNCYNVKSISGEAENILRIGGITGNIGNTSSISSCYSTGTIYANEAKTVTKGVILGRNNGGTIENIYYKKYDETNGVGGANIPSNLGNEAEMVKTEDEMKKLDFITALNKNNLEAIWKKDEKNINGGLPILNWQ